MKTVKMFYVIADGVLSAVCGSEEMANTIAALLGQKFPSEVLTLEQLFAKNAEQRVVIPEEMSWVINSDRQHHARIEREKGDENITGKNSLSPMVLKYTNATKTEVKHPMFGYSVSVEYAKAHWPFVKFED